MNATPGRARTGRRALLTGALGSPGRAQARLLCAEGATAAPDRATRLALVLSADPALPVCIVHSPGPEAAFVCVEP